MDIIRDDTRNELTSDEKKEVSDRDFDEAR